MSSMRPGEDLPHRETLVHRSDVDAASTPAYSTATPYAAGDAPSGELRDRVRWGPILAGLLAAIATLLVLTVLGLAIGLSAFKPNDAGNATVSTAAALWGALSALIAFFVGGWIAGRSAAHTGEPNGLLNGAMVGVAAIVLLLWMIGAGLGNLFGAVGNNLADIANIGANISSGDAASAARAAYNDARNSAWGTLAGLVLALGASAFGGWIGQTRRDLLVQTPVERRTRARL